MAPSQRRFTWQEMVQYWRTHSSRWADLDYGQDPEGLTNVCYPGAPLWLNRYYARSQKLVYEKLYRRLHAVDAKKRALEVGCGAGRWCHFLAVRGWKVVGVDLQPEIIESNTRRYPHIEFYCTPVQNYAGTELFDLVSAVTVIQHIPFDEQEVVFRKLRALLKTGGCLIMLDSTHFQTLHVFSRTVQNWQTAVETAGFKCLAVNRYDYTPFLRLHNWMMHRIMSTIGRTANSHSAVTPESFANCEAETPRTFFGKLDAIVARLATGLDSIVDPLLIRLNTAPLARHSGFLFVAV